MSKSKYGLPYMGSKGEICDKIIRVFPKADHFYDLFGGGFSITHAMLARRSKDYKQFHFNEIRPGICDLIKDSINGKYNYNVFKPQWISREEFYSKKDENPYIKLCWSFGNNGIGYLFSKNIEKYKKSMHNAIIFNEFDSLAKEVLGMDKFKDGYSINDRRFFLASKIKTYRKTKIPEVLKQFLSEKQLQQLEKLQRLEQLEKLQRLEQLERLQQLQQLKQLKQLQQLERLERLQQLQQLQRLKQLQRLEFYNKSYDEVEIKENSIIYCDPPYLGTAEYDGKFDHKKFLDWAHNQTNPVFISEYDIRDKRFTLCFKVKKISRLSTLNRESKTEKVYVNKAGFELLK